MDIQIQQIWIDLHQELKAFILKKVKHTQVADDILQDVFLKIHSRIHTLKNPKKLTAWVYQITRNTIIDYFRSTKNTGTDIENLSLATQATDEPLYHQLSRCVQAKIKQLPPKYKNAILLTSFQQYSQKELAENLGISYSGAKTRVQRAREKLKAALMDCDNLETDSRGQIIDYQS